MMSLKGRWFVGVLSLVLVASAPGQTFVAEPVRPTGVSTPVPQDEASTPKPKAKAKAKASRKSASKEEDTPVATLPNGVPAVKARSVMIVDARTGQSLYEKNADETDRK